MLMNAKKYLVVAIVLNTVLLGVAACLYHPWQTHRGPNDLRRTALIGPSGKFGPVLEFVLPAARRNGTVEILDLETGRMLLQPSLERLDVSPRAILAWTRTNGLDISCSVWGGGAGCVTYGMTVVPVEEKCWKETTEEELLGNPALAPKMHPPRRQLVLGSDGPDTYVFRTSDGTLGMCQLVGVTEDRQGVKIRYKLVNPKRSDQIALSPVLRKGDEP